jgi:hypothetical protein
MAQASGVFKQLTYKAEVTYGTVPAAASAQSLRRVTSDLSLNKDTYQSNEIRTDQQVQDMRHGVRRVAGTLSGELSPGTYKDFFAAALRRDFAAVTAISGASLTIAGSGPTYTVTRGAGDFLTDGVKKGDVVRLTVGSLNAANISKNLLVSNVTATVLTVRPLNGVAMVAEGPIANCTVTVTGKKTFAPITGHTNQSFSIEHWYSDVAQSEVFSGCQPTTLDLQLPPTGLATIAIGLVGKDITTATSQYFTSPTAATSTGLTASVNGIVLVNGTAVAVLTGLTMQIQSNRSGDPVVGSNTISVQFPGRILVSGQATAYFEDATFRDAFVNETEMSLVVVLSSDNTATSKFVGFTLPRCKLAGSAKNDGEAGIVQTIPFTALLPLTGGAGIANDLSTISVQDSDA